MNKTKKTALYGVLTALALILGYIETLIPAFVAIPGMQLGLTNIVVLFSLYAVSERAAIIINIVRIIVLAMLFGSPLSFAFSLVGGCLSTAVMILLKKSDRFGMIGVSTAGGVTHNIGQIIVAMLVMNTKAIALYLPVLWITGIFSGMLVRFIGGLIATRIRTD